MPTVLVTGSGGLIGSEAVRFFAAQGFHVVGIDNDMRSAFFGRGASTLWNRTRLQQELGPRYQHYHLDIRDRAAIENIFKEFSSDIDLIIHAAAQPSHDWAARDPHTDFTVNANGTLVLLEAMRQFTPGAVFIFTSTNKVYGDRPNRLPLVELETRWEVEPESGCWEGVDETMSIDDSKHSLFGASKAAADLLVQEYGKYFGLKTAAFRGGCLTGPAHSGTRLHGFLSYLMHCVAHGEPYTIYGYKGKQVRDNIHSYDLVNAFWHFYRSPRVGEVYNIGGSRHSNCSVLEAVALCEQISGGKARTHYSDEHRSGDHIWYVSDVGKFRAHYPEWGYRYDLRGMLQDVYQGQASRSKSA
jgi:CDP-paratose 2-epimerase